uniref:Interleukin-7 n=1 Tax=Cynoglossus semilaevis TaxID=244447 RepID=A0A3P8VDU3_CYNSE
MPLLCISLLVLLLLPQTLSCEGKWPAEDVKSNMVIVQTHLNDTWENITASLSKNCSNLKHKFPNCTPDIRGQVSDNSLSLRDKVVETIHNLTCSMTKLGLSQTEKLSKAVLNPIRCPCGKSAKIQRRRKRRNEHHKTTRKLCKAKAILSSVTQCYEILNSLMAT